MGLRMDGSCVVLESINNPLFFLPFFLFTVHCKKRFISYKTVCLGVVFIMFIFVLCGKNFFLLGFLQK